MLALQGYYDGNMVRTLEKIHAKKNQKLKLGLKYFSPCPIYIASKQGEPVAYPHKTNL